ncbi:phage tail protein [Pseudoalteromonas denitrificans]|jgi:hypothetical protein|uniref:P2-related tail formation protein n=1 Tax=Pseudoalteromonas denitrificans DSM 6059 TaxID=1123010 RepID=A0A1I1PWC4_9GAMM|nr:phage tail protein [Pseudoalteromonas denitrificans]SFD14194.1 P2-related tail formation protein [Pseudoalteromonas denitrificans DSM 6059]
MTILPPSAKPLVHTLENINQMPLSIDTAIGKLQTLKSDPSENLLHWLVWEYGLEAILPYSHDLKKVLKDGLSWQRIRGTPNSLNLALGWIDLNNVTIEAEPPGRHFYEYQLETGKIPGDKDVSRVLNLAKLSAPTRSKLARLYHNYDVRKLDLSYGKFGQFLSDYSGTYFYDGEFTASKVSFARDHSVHLTYKDTRSGNGNDNDNGNENSNTNIEVSHNRQRSLSHSYLKKHILSQFIFGDCLNTGFASNTINNRSHTASLLLGARTWLGSWSDVSWLNARYGVVGINASYSRSIGGLKVSAANTGTLMINNTELESVLPLTELPENK